MTRYAGRPIKFPVLESDVDPALPPYPYKGIPVTVASAMFAYGDMTSDGVVPDNTFDEVLNDLLSLNTMWCIYECNGPASNLIPVDGGSQCTPYRTAIMLGSSGSVVDLQYDYLTPFPASPLDCGPPYTCQVATPRATYFTPGFYPTLSDPAPTYCGAGTPGTGTNLDPRFPPSDVPISTPVYPTYVQPTPSGPYSNFPFSPASVGNALAAAGGSVFPQPLGPIYKIYTTTGTVDLTDAAYGVFCVGHYANTSDADNYTAGWAKNFNVTEYSAFIPVPPSANPVTLFTTYVQGMCIAGTPPPSGASPVITSTAPTSATVGYQLVYNVVATGYPAPLFTLSGAPADISLDAVTGNLYWTPTSTGVVTFDIIATSITSPTFTQPVTITVGLPGLLASPTLTGSPPSTGVVGQLYTTVLTATGTEAPTYSADAGPAPVIADVGSLAPIIRWFPSAAGTFAITIRATNSQGFAIFSWSVTVTDPTNSAPVFTSTVPAGGPAGQSWEYIPSVTGGNVTFSGAGVDPATGRVAYNFRTAGESAFFTIVATNSHGTATQLANPIAGTPSVNPYLLIFGQSIPLNPTLRVTHVYDTNGDLTAGAPTINGTVAVYLMDFGGRQPDGTTPPSYNYICDLFTFSLAANTHVDWDTSSFPHNFFTHDIAISIPTNWGIALGVYNLGGTFAGLSSTAATNATKYFAQFIKLTCPDPTSGIGGLDTVFHWDAAVYPADDNPTFALPFESLAGCVVEPGTIIKSGSDFTVIDGITLAGGNNEWRWDMGDGTIIYTLTLGSNGLVSHSHSPGTYTVTVVHYGGSVASSQCISTMTLTV